MKWFLWWLFIVYLFAIKGLELPPTEDSWLVFLLAYLPVVAVVLIGAVAMIDRNSKREMQRLENDHKKRKNSLESEYRGKINNLESKVDLFKTIKEQLDGRVKGLEQQLEKETKIELIGPRTAQQDTESPRILTTSLNGLSVSEVKNLARTMAYDIQRIVSKYEPELAQIKADRDRLINERSSEGKTKGIGIAGIDQLSQFGRISIVDIENKRQLNEVRLQEFKTEINSFEASIEITEKKTLREIHESFDSSIKPLQIRDAILFELGKTDQIPESLIIEEDYNMTNIWEARKVVKELITLSSNLK